MKKGLKQKKAGQKNVKVPKILGLGNLNMNFLLTLREDESHIFTKLSEGKDLAEVHQNKALQDRIQIQTTSSNLITTLLWINKANQNKSFVELMTLSPLNFPNETNFLKEIITYVTEHNYLFLNESQVRTDHTWDIIFEIRCGKETKQIKVQTAKKQEETTKSEEGSGNSFVDKIKCDYSDFELLIVDLEEILSLDTSTSKTITEFKDYLTVLSDTYKNISIVINYPNIIENINSVNLETVNVINDILGLTDFYLFEKKEGVALFNMLHQVQAEDSAIKEITEKQLSTFFKKEIKHVRKTQKYGLFLGELQKIYVIEGTNPSDNEYEYDLHLYPKINHTNQKVVDEYKKTLLLVSNFSDLFFMEVFFLLLSIKNCFIQHF
jgi:hypothetical protein